MFLIVFFFFFFVFVVVVDVAVVVVFVAYVVLAVDAILFIFFYSSLPCLTIRPLHRRMMQNNVCKITRLDAITYANKRMSSTSAILYIWELLLIRLPLLFFLF